MRLRGSGPNTVLGGAGNDIVEAYAKGRAAIDCGPGYDRVNIGFDRLVQARATAPRSRSSTRSANSAESNVRPGSSRRLRSPPISGVKAAQRKDSTMRLPLIALVTAVLSLALAGTASAKQSRPDPADFSYLATIDCGSGPIQVGSTDDIYAELVDLRTGRTYDPVAWDVSAGDFQFVDSLEGVTKRNSSSAPTWTSGSPAPLRSSGPVATAIARDRRQHGGRHHDRWDRHRHGRHSRRR